MTPPTLSSILSILFVDVKPDKQTKEHFSDAECHRELSGLSLVPQQREWNYCSVTAEDIQASLGNSRHRCLGEALGVTEERSLLQLVAGEVAKKVNCRLAVIRQSTSSQQSEESVQCETPESQTKHMSPNNVELPGEEKLSSDKEYLVIDLFHPSSPDDVTMAEEVSTEGLYRSGRVQNSPFL